MRYELLEKELDKVFTKVMYDGPEGRILTVAADGGFPARLFHDTVSLEDLVKRIGPELLLDEAEYREEFGDPDAPIDMNNREDAAWLHEILEEQAMTRLWEAPGNVYVCSEWDGEMISSFLSHEDVQFPSGRRFLVSRNDDYLPYSFLAAFEAEDDLAFKKMLFSATLAEQGWAGCSDEDRDLVRFP